MAVITSTIAAIAAAATAISTVGVVAALPAIAVAAVNIATVVGVAGMVVSGVGMATGNKTLMGVGQIMGYVGMAGAVGGGLLGGLSNTLSGTGTFMEGAKQTFSAAGQNISKAWETGVGSWFSGAGATSAAPGSVAPVSTAPATAPSTAPPLAASEPAAGLSPMPNAGAPSAGARPAVGLSPLPNAGGGPAAPVPTTGPSAEAGLGVLNRAANTAPGTTTVGNLNVPGSQIGTTYQPNANLMTDIASSGISKAKGLWDSLPDYAKFSLMTTGGQGLTSAAQGYFQGLSAEEQLEFQKLVNEQRQAQIQLENRNASAGPLVSFAPRTGVLNRRTA